MNEKSRKLEAGTRLVEWMLGHGQAYERVVACTHQFG